MPITEPDKDFENIKDFEDTSGESLEEGMQTLLIERVKQILSGYINDVQMTTRLNKSPVALKAAAGQMSIHLERLMRNHQQQTAFASTRILNVNPYHPLIIKLSDMINDDAQKEKIEEVSKLLLDQAKIAEGEAITNPSFYAEKMGEYILKAM